MVIDLKIFKDRIKQKLKESEFENQELYTKWQQIIEEQKELGHLYKPQNKLTLHGFIKICPNDGSKLLSKTVARKWGSFGLWEYRILTCPVCGYEYAVHENIRSN